MLDDLDRSLVHALQVDARAPFGVIAAALGVSDRTIARRYTRLRSQGVLRVVGVPDSRRLGRTEWFLRLRCVPDGSLPIAHALARRDDISWIMLTSAGTEITCMASTRSADQRDALLLGTLPRSRRVVQVDALCVLRTFFGGATGWNGRSSALTADQVSRIARTDTHPPGEYGERTSWTPRTNGSSPNSGWTAADPSPASPPHSAAPRPPPPADSTGCSAPECCTSTSRSHPNTSATGSKPCCG